MNKVKNSVELDMKDNKSFWQHKYGDYQANAPLDKGEHHVDVLIIGGGFTGLTCAREVKKNSPEKEVMLLEALEIGFGASGRNGGFSMTLFGLEPETTILRWGKQKTKEAQAYMEKAIKYVRELVEEEQLDSDYEHTGMWRAAYSESQEKRLRKTYNILTEIGGANRYQYLNEQQAQAELNSDKIRAAIYEPDTGILDPCKHVRELKRLAEAQGAKIYENTRVTNIIKNSNGIRVETNGAVVHAKKLVLATNAWGQNLKGINKIQRKQFPIWTYQVVTDPLTEEEWKELKWHKRMSIEDNRQLVHYMRITSCGRITMGGGDIGVEYNKQAMSKWHDKKIWENLEQHLRWLFPTLKEKKVYYKWGGAVSANLDMTPEIGFIENDDIIFSAGCIGHGVSLTQLNGKLIADLLAGKDNDLTNFWIVNRQAIPMPPGNLLAYTGAKVIEGVLKGVDAFESRKLPK